MKILYIPSVMAVCIDSVTRNDASGRIYHRYSEEPVLFASFTMMLGKIDEICDRMNFPQAATQARSFKSGDRKKTVQRKETMAIDAQSVTKQRGEKGTFVVYVQYRQHATWQGQVVWAEKDKTQSFRSALELLKLIDSALDLEEAQQETKDIDRENVVGE